jgi:hypothetical protein
MSNTSSSGFLEKDIKKAMKDALSKGKNGVLKFIKSDSNTIFIP